MKKQQKVTRRMNSVSIKVFLLLGISPLLFFCSGGEEEKTKMGESFVQEEESNMPGESQAYMLPTPLQVSTFLHMYNGEFKDDIVHRKEGEHPTAHEQALNLGVNLIDLGYATIYRKNERAKEALQRTRDLMEKLEIKTSVKDKMVKKFKENHENVDSLSRIILQSYQDAHDYFNENARKEVGLLIITGAYLEGLFMILNHQVNNRQAYEKGVAQQKLFLSNLIDLLEKYGEKRKTEELIKNLKELESTFNQVPVNIDEKKQNINTQVSDKTLDKIRAKANLVRADIVGNNPFSTSKE